MIRFFALCFLLFAIFSFFNCNSTSDENIQKKILRVALIDNPTNLDPRTNTKYSGGN